MDVIDQEGHGCSTEAIGETKRLKFFPAEYSFVPYVCKWN